MKGEPEMPEKDILKLFKESLKNKNSYLPNLLTASRLVGAFVIPALFLSGNIPGAVVATAAFGATDFFDGLAARKLNGYSEFGRILDPIVDKVFATVPALAILPTMPILTANVGLEALIAYINAKSYTGKGNPKSSFLGKFKTFCLFPTIGLAYLAATLKTPEATLLATAASLLTLGVQGAVAKDYYQKAKQEQQENITTPEIETPKEEEQEKVLEKKQTAEYTNTKQKDSGEIASLEQPFDIDSIDIEALATTMPELIDAPITERKQPNGKVFMKKSINK